MLRVFTLILLMGCAALASAQTSDLMISEYVEGAGYDNAIEIYNGTAHTVNLGGYTIDRYSNGSTVAISIALDAVDIGSGDMHVLAYDSFSQPDLVNQFSSDLNFDGNDAVVLAHNGVPVDRIGRVGENPGDYWFCNDGTTQNHTLRRLPDVCTGSTDIAGVFDPCDEWMFLPSGTLSGLGNHNADCGTVPVAGGSWGAIKANFR